MRRSYQINYVEWTKKVGMKLQGLLDWDWSPSTRETKKVRINYFYAHNSAKRINSNREKEGEVLEKKGGAGFVG